MCVGKKSPILRHLLCNPIVAQFIMADEFDAPTVGGAFAKSELDSDYVADQEQLLTAGWHRLQELYKISAETPLNEYPLEQFRG